MESNDITLLSVQKILKPKIEDIIPEYLDGDMKKNALDFVAYLRENKMKPVWTLHNAWKAIYKSKPIYYIRLGRDWVRNKKDAKWEVTPYLNHINEYEYIIINEGWQNLVWDNLNFCRSCIYGCAPGINKTVLGKEIKNLCGGMVSGRFVISLVDPDEADINVIKMLIELEKKVRKEWG